MKTNPVKGCIDYLPKEMELRQQVIEKILKTYKNNGFLQVKTPVLENIENLTSGDSGDNTKMMFKTIKRGAKLNLNKPNLTENDLVEEGLRYDLTVPLARLFTKYRNDLPFPFKSVQIEDSFRAEKPQEGRNRQFTQCDADIWGESSILGEIEIITTIMEAYSSVGLPNVICRISDRRILTSLVKFCGFKDSEMNDVCITIDKLEKIGTTGVQEELQNKGYNAANVLKLIEVLSNVQKDGLVNIQNYGVDNKDIENLKNIISTVKPLLPNGYTIVFDISIVRGQGYYTGTVYEMYCYDSGYRGAIGGGGRYDKMYEKFAGSVVPAVGFGLGLDSVLLTLKKLQKDILFQNKKLALIYNENNSLEQIMQVKQEFKNEFDVSLFPQPKNFKEFLRKATLNGFTYLAKVDKKIVEKI